MKTNLHLLFVVVVNSIRNFDEAHSAKKGIKESCVLLNAEENMFVNK